MQRSGGGHVVYLSMRAEEHVCSAYFPSVNPAISSAYPPLPDSSFPASVVKCNKNNINFSRKKVEGPLPSKKEKAAL